MGDTQTIMLTMLAICGGGGVLASSSGVEQQGVAAPAIAAVPYDKAASDTRLQPLTISRSDDGLFYLNGAIGDAPIRFLIDTGANLTVLAADDAARARLGTSDATITLETVNGTARIGAARVDRVELGGHDLVDLSVGIANQGLPVSLLGQDALSRLGTITIRDDELTIHPPAPEGDR
jgi:aspartyl protease family protein